MQAFHFLIQTARALAIEPVGDEKNHRALPQHAARPLALDAPKRARNISLSGARASVDAPLSAGDACADAVAN